ncbi:VIT1/CCC1 transporter family protein [Halobaculum halobium]|uniref:VIT1/CCC1 transporter family protein n=1 Tax=Halobaculum halobium TaxID=3032281 RepID=A0ABD5TCQ6_9EURY|nr:VIT1/CCC1 transporter family protein [Halobaculum sp. SYNS20]
MRGRGRTKTTVRHRVSEPALTGLTAGAVVVPAPLFAAAVAVDGWTAGLVGLAAAIGVALYAALAAAGDDDGGLSAADDPVRRAGLAGGGAFLAGALPSLVVLAETSWGFPLAVALVAAELAVVGSLRVRLVGGDVLETAVRVALGGALAAALGAGVGSLAGV